MQMNRSTDLSRRQMLAKGATLGGVAWAVPTVTAITLSPANAASPSGAPPKPPKPPKPPDLPTAEPTKEPTRPPAETPKPKPPSEKTPRPEKPGHKPSAEHTPPAARDEDTTAGGGELPDTGPGDIAKTVTLSGALAAGGAALYAASRRAGERSDGQQEESAT